MMMNVMGLISSASNGMESNQYRDVLEMESVVRTTAMRYSPQHPRQTQPRLVSICAMIDVFHLLYLSLNESFHIIQLYLLSRLVILLLEVALMAMSARVGLEF